MVPPLRHRRALDTGLLWDPRGALFLMSEVPLYAAALAIWSSQGFMFLRSTHRGVVEGVKAFLNKTIRENKTTAIINLGLPPVRPEAS